MASEPGSTAVPPNDELFRLLVESILDYAIFLLDPDGNVTSWNEGAARIKGYSAEEILGRHFSTFYTPEAVESGHPAHVLEIAAAQGRYEEEGMRVRKDGSRFWANVVITAVHDAEGRLCGFAKVTREVTEGRLAEESLREARAEVERRRVSERQAVEINDNILQELVVAKYALDKGEEQQTRVAIESTLTQTRNIITKLLEEVNVEAGALRRTAGPDPDV